MSKGNESEALVAGVKKLHAFYYLEDEENFLNSAAKFLLLHEIFEELFNAAGITETLCENNPGEVSAAEARIFLGLSQESGEADE